MAHRGRTGTGQGSGRRVCGVGCPLTRDAANLVSPTISTTASNVGNGIYRPNGLRIVVLNATTTLALIALYFLTVYPDAVIDVFSEYSAPQIYDNVPITQRHRIILHQLAARNVSLAALQLSLQDHNRNVRGIDLLHVEDLASDNCAWNRL